MIFLSAQPDDVYFLWQLQLQLFNFRSNGISIDDIHILVGYVSKCGLNVFFERFIQNNPHLHIFTYADTRKNRKYLSSIRPHLIYKHFKKYPWLQDEFIFYHDSDILFIRSCNWSNLLYDDVWYVSDTRSYLDSSYIISHIGEDSFIRMCQIIGVSPQLVKQNDENAGGAQYIIKKSTIDFWSKVEDDCEKLYSYLEYQRIIQHSNDDLWNSFQVWCVDMWVVFWNALLINKNVKIHRDLDFCTVFSNYELLKIKNIMHYTGARKGISNVFNKLRYQTHSPFYEDLPKTTNINCSSFVWDQILAYRECLDGDRFKLPHVLFVYLVSSCNNDFEEQRLKVLKRFYDRYFFVDFFIGTEQCYLEFIQNNSELVSWIMPNNVILPVDLIIDIYNNSSCISSNVDYVFPLLQVDSLNTNVFCEILDIEYLEINKELFLSLGSVKALSVLHTSNCEYEKRVNYNMPIYKLHYYVN